MEALLDAMLRWLLASAAATESILIVIAVTVILYGIAVTHVPDNNKGKP